MLAKMVDTGGNFAAGVVDTGDAPWRANIAANFRKNSNSLNVMLWGWGENGSWENQKQKILWHCPFKGAQAWDIRYELFILSDPIWVGDLRNEPKKPFV